MSAWQILNECLQWFAICVLFWATNICADCIKLLLDAEIKREELSEKATNGDKA